jgi:hypothetical protein
MSSTIDTGSEPAGGQSAAHSTAHTAQSTAQAGGCVLCGQPGASRFAQVDLPGCNPRQYLHCCRCDLVWLHPDQLPSTVAERRHYDTHENSPDDPGYRAFLNRLAAPLLAQLPSGQPLSGLDFGCGPGPTLSVMLREAGHQHAGL